MGGLEVRALTKVYGSGRTAVRAVDGVSFRLEEGEFAAVLGPSGSGKTTLLAMLGALLQPTEGEILLGGRDIARLSERERTRLRQREIGFVFQSYNLVSYLTAYENVLAVADFAGRKDRAARERARALLEELGLGDRLGFLPAELSGGERQRVAIARALMNDPRLVLVDEPTASLDSQRGRQVVEALVAEIKGRGKMGIMVTHDERVTGYADRLLRIQDGRLAADVPQRR
ncbi:MAG TPA: ABC transporter ATP-binding protein [Dehalococcoidia bacterium]